MVLYAVQDFGVGFSNVFTICIKMLTLWFLNLKANYRTLISVLDKFAMIN